jgi:hypothetical protein
MSKKFTFIFTFILLFGVFVIWGINRFFYPLLPPEFSNLWVMTLSVLGAITAISGAVKAIQYIGELFFPQKPEPSEEDKLLQKLRELPWTISEESAKDYTSKILGDRSNDFWEQIRDNHQNKELLSVLVVDPFMLEGLICIYRNELGLLPKNTGALLDKLIKTQWKQEKININQWIELDDVLFTFGRLVIKDVPSIKYPVKISSEGRWRYWKNPYLGMLINIGGWVSISKASRQTRNKLKKHFDNWKRNIYKRVENKPRPVVFAVVFVLSPIAMISYFMEILLSFIFMPIRAVTRLIRNSLEGFGAHKVTRFFEKIRGNFDIHSKILERDAKRFLLAAEKAHIIKRSESSFNFRHNSWVDYFAAYYIVKSEDVMAALAEDDKFNPGWRRLSPERAGIAICASGLLENPEQFHRELLLQDPYLLTQCVTSGLDLHGTFYDQIEQTIANELAKIILQVREAGEWRSFDFAQILQKIRYDPADALTILDAIREIEIEPVNFELAKLIGNYGKDVVDILIFRLNKATNKEKRFIFLILSWIGDKRAISAIQETLTSLENDDFDAVRRTGITVLTICFEDKNSLNELYVHLFEKDERDYYWHTMARIGEQSLLWTARSISIWRDLYPDKLHIIRREFLGLCGSVGNSAKIREALAKYLRDENEIAFTQLYIEAIGKIKAAEEEEFLLEKINSLDDITCLFSVEALGNLDNPAVIPSLKQKLFHRNEQVRQSAKEAIGHLTSKQK